MPPNNKSKEKQEKKDYKKLISNGIWAYKTLFHLDPLGSIFMAILPIITRVLPTASAYLAGRFIDQLVSLTESGFFSLYQLSIQSPIISILLLVTLIQLVQTLLNRTDRFLSNKFRIVDQSRFSLELYKKVSELDVSQYESPQIADSIKKGFENIYKIRTFVDTSRYFVSQVVGLAIAATISFKVSPLISFFILLTAIPNNLIYAGFIKKLWHFYNNSTEENRKLRWLLGTINSELMLPEHKVTSANLPIFNIANKLDVSLREREIAPHRYRYRATGLTSLIDILNTIIPAIFLIGEVLAGRISVGQFTFYRSRFSAFENESDDIISSLIEVADAGNYLSHVRRLWELTPEIISGKRKLTSGLPPKIEFKNVSFKYPNSDRYALKNISLTINPGEEIAIVGQNGAGKTTLIKLILRFYDTTEGEILIDNHPIKDINLKSYYRLFGTLFQEYNRYEALNIGENIWVGDSDKTLKLEEIKKAADQAEAKEFIEALPKKYNQMLNKQFTGGTNLSTGQWQKLALARMFYRDFSVLILDEPTASIDAEAEYKIFQRIYQTSKGKSLIIISHRFSTVRNAQKIYVLDGGKIAEQGSHEELVQLNGKYAKAFKLQAKGYSI